MTLWSGALLYPPLELRRVSEGRWVFVPDGLNEGSLARSAWNLCYPSFTTGTASHISRQPGKFHVLGKPAH